MGSWKSDPSLPDTVPHIDVDIAIVSTETAARVSMNLSECTQSCTTLLVLQSVQWRRSEAASNEIHFRSKVRTAKAATCPEILCCAPCAHREQLPQLRPWQYCDLVHTRHNRMQYYYVWQLSLLHNLGLVQGWVLSAARSKGGLTKPRTPSSLPSMHTKVFQSGQSVS